MGIKSLFLLKSWVLIYWDCMAFFQLESWWVWCLNNFIPMVPFMIKKLVYREWGFFLLETKKVVPKSPKTHSKRWVHSLTAGSFNSMLETELHTLGPPINAIITRNLRFCPPLKSFANVFAFSCNPISSSKLSI